MLENTPKVCAGEMEDEWEPVESSDPDPRGDSRTKALRVGANADVANVAPTVAPTVVPPTAPAAATSAPAAIQAHMRSAFAEIQQVCTSSDAGGQTLPRPPIMQAPPLTSDIAKWEQFEIDHTTRADIYVYVDAENVLKTMTTTLDVKWPRLSCDTLISVVRLAFGEWISATATNIPVPKIEWMIYSKRPLLDSARCSFVIPNAGSDTRDGDETDDVMCVAAACARVRTGTGKVCLVSGDEMRWTSLCEKVQADWEKIERGPRDSPSAGNRLVSYILAALRRCGGNGATFLECASQPPTEAPPPASPASYAPLLPGVPVPTDLTLLLPSGEMANDVKSSAFGDAAGAVLILAASLMALTLVQGL